MLDNLKKYKIILASKSPRRRELLGLLDIPFEVKVPEGVREIYPPYLSMYQVPVYLSGIKADAFFTTETDDDLLVITADTVVICDEKVIGKPKNEEDARNMLRFLSGKSHEVVTGVTVSAHNRRESFSVTSRVKFASLSDEEIRFYVSRYKPLDKAGAYGIQEWIGAAAVEGIEGSFYNVMGLPVHQLFQVLKKF